MTPARPSDAPAAAPADGPEALLAALRRLAGEGRIEIRVDPRPLHHIDSPVASEADGNLWLYPVPPLAALLWWWQGMAAGLAAFGLGILLYLTLGRAYVHRRIERRVRQRALGNVEVWRKLWRFRGLTLVARDRPGLGDCASPDGNWIGFVRALTEPRVSCPPRSP